MCVRKALNTMILKTNNLEVASRTQLSICVNQGGGMAFFLGKLINVNKTISTHPSNEYTSLKSSG